MTEISDTPDLKEINALKKKLNWGEVPAIYHMVSTSVGDLDGILTHGFESSFKNILDKRTWNLPKLGGKVDKFGHISVMYKPKIALRHVFNEMGYELHCYPMVNGEKINRNMVDYPHCPFINWIPETMRRLFRVNSLANYIIFINQNGDEADFELIKHIYRRVEELIGLLKESFEVQDIKGYTIPEFYKEVDSRSSESLSDNFSDMINTSTD